MKRFVLAALFLAVGPAAAHAQLVSTPTSTSSEPGSTQSIDDVRQDYHLHAGPFYLNPAVLLKNLGWDTNVFNQADQAQKDFTFTLTPQSDVALPIARRGLIKGTVGADVVYYRRFASERSVDPQFTVRAEGYANRLTLFAQESYLNTRARPSFEIDLRSRHLENDLGAGADVHVTPKLSVEGALLRARTRYSGDAVFQGTSLQQTLNRNSDGYSVTAREKLTPLTTLSLRYEALQDRFLYSRDRDANSFSVMPGLEFKPRALISGSAFVGYRNFKPLNAALPGYAGFVAQLALSYTLLGATMFGVTYDRNVDYSYTVETPYYVDNSPGVFVRREIAGHLDAIVNAGRSYYRYLEVGLQPAQSSARLTNITETFGANVGYRLKRQTRIGFGFSYYTRNSNTAVPSYSGLQIGTTVTYGMSQ